MKSLILIACLAVLGGIFAQEYELVWEDNFDTLDLNKWQYEVTAWGGGNGEFQVYTPDPANSYTQDGHLFIKATRTSDNTNPLTGEPFGEDFLFNGVLDLEEMYGVCTNEENNGCRREGQNGIIPPIMSARLRSFERFAFKYGRVEVRARMPLGDWMWPAIWMLPEDWVYGDGDWPASGEIDIVECRGNFDLKIPDGTDIGIQEAASTLHWGVARGQNRYYLTNGPTHNMTSDYANNFHDYVLEWNENGIRFTLDGTLLMDVPNPLIPENPGWTGFYDFGAPWLPGYENPWVEKADEPLMAPFDKRFHFIMNIAVGGTNGFFPDSAVNQGGAAPKPWENDQSQPMEAFWADQATWYSTWQTELAAMEVDYIRVYQRV